MIRKAVIPAAGRGTRMLPFTRAVPKEMLPILDTPVIQHVVEEAVASGLDDIIIVISRDKRAIEEHFEKISEGELSTPGLSSLRRILDQARIRFVFQKEPRGLGHAVAQASAAVGDEPFAVLLGDVVTVSTPPVTRQLINLFEQRQAPALALQNISPDLVSHYGVISGEAIGSNLYRINGIVEKPRAQDAPSSLIVASRYVLTPDVFEHLAAVPTGYGGEIQLTDALGRMLKDRFFFGLQFDGERYDLGNPAGFLDANLAFAGETPRL